MWRFTVRYDTPNNCGQNIKWYRIFLSACVFCFLLTTVFTLSGCGQKKPPAPGSALPKFTLSDLKGAKITVPDDFSGKVIIVRFWVDWCKSCAIEMPMIDAAYNKYKDRGLVVIAVNVGQQKDIAEAFVTKLRLSYPVVLDTDSSITKKYGVKAVPFTFIVDRKGIIKKRIFGEAGSETLEKIIQDLL
jgi:peroxiredoxin